MNMKSVMLVAALAAMGSATAGVVGDAIRPWADNGQLPGAISLLSNDGVEEIDCVGFADVAAQRAITLDDPFMQCSQTKGFCGVTIS